MHAGPCRVCLGVDIQTDRITLLAVCAAGGEFRAVCHDDLDVMIVRMNVFLHGLFSKRQSRKSRGYTQMRQTAQGRLGLTLVEFKFDPAVPGTGNRAFLIFERLIFAESCGCEPVRGNALVYKEAHNGKGPGDR